MAKMKEQKKNNRLSLRISMEDLKDIATIELSREEPSRPLEDYLAEREK